MKKVFFTLFIITLSCSSFQNSSDILLKFKKSHNEKIFENYPVLLDTIVDGSDSELALHPAGYFAHKFTGYFLIKEYDRDSFFEMKKYLKSFNLKDHEIAKIPRSESDTLRTHNVAYQPDFSSNAFEDIDEYLLDKKTVFTFKSEKGIFVQDAYKDELKSNDNNHGYSQGATIIDQKQAIIFWIMVW